MRLVSWNCGRGKHAVKLPPLLKLGPDIAVIQETPEPATQLADTQLWLGTNPNQGLLLLGFGKWRLEPFRPADSPSQFFLPARIAGPRESFNLLAVWTKAGARHPRYLSNLLDGLGAYRDFMESAPTVVAGDLNAYWYENEEPFRRFNLISAYHAHYRATIRAERHPTYYFYWNEARRYHFDYCLVPRQWRRRIKQVRVGTYDQWTGARLSDHCPLIVDLSERRARRDRPSIAEPP